MVSGSAQGCTGANTRNFELALQAPRDTKYTAGASLLSRSSEPMERGGLRPPPRSPLSHSSQYSDGSIMIQRGPSATSQMVISFNGKSV